MAAGQQALHAGFATFRRRARGRLAPVCMVARRHSDLLAERRQRLRRLLSQSHLTPKGCRGLVSRRCNNCNKRSSRAQKSTEAASSSHFFAPFCFSHEVRLLTMDECVGWADRDGPCTRLVCACPRGGGVRGSMARRSAQGWVTRAVADGKRHKAVDHSRARMEHDTERCAAARRSVQRPVRLPSRHHFQAQAPNSDSTCADGMSDAPQAAGRAASAAAPSVRPAGPSMVSAIVAVFFLLTHTFSQPDTVISVVAARRARHLGQTFTYLLSRVRASGAASTLAEPPRAMRFLSKTCRLATAFTLLLLFQGVPASSAQPPGFDVR